MVILAPDEGFIDWLEGKLLEDDARRRAPTFGAAPDGRRQRITPYCHRTLTQFVIFDQFDETGVVHQCVLACVNFYQATAGRVKSSSRLNAQFR